MQGLEKIWADAKYVCFGVLVLWGAWPMEHGDHQPVTQQWHRRVAHGLHPGDLRKAPLQVAIKGVHLRALVTDQCRVDSENQNVVCIESNVDAAQILQRTHQ